MLRLIYAIMQLILHGKSMTVLDVKAVSSLVLPIITLVKSMLADRYPPYLNQT